GVAIVDDPIERDVAQPPCRLARSVDQPRPVDVIVHVEFAVGLDDRRGRDKDVVETPPVDPLIARDETMEMLSEPLAVAVARRRVEPVGIDLGAQDREIAERAVGPRGGSFENGPKAIMRTSNVGILRCILHWSDLSSAKDWISIASKRALAVSAAGARIPSTRIDDGGGGGDLARRLRRRRKACL